MQGCFHPWPADQGKTKEKVKIRLPKNEVIRDNKTRSSLTRTEATTKTEKGSNMCVGWEGKKM